MRPPKMLPPTYNLRMRELRQASGVTFATLSLAVGRGVDALMAYERGDRRPHREVIENLARFYGLDMADVLGRFGLGCQFVNPEGISIGVDSKLGRNCVLDARKGKISIGTGCEVGHGTVISTWGFFDNEGNARIGDITIQDDVKIEPGCTVGPGTVIPRYARLYNQTTRVADDKPEERQGAAAAVQSTAGECVPAGPPAKRKRGRPRKNPVESVR